MIKIAICAYRNWATRVYSLLQQTFECEWPYKEMDMKIRLLRTPDDLLDNPEFYNVIYFVGWSWKVPEHVVNNIPCYCIHPSPLPKYRGGSPLQNQIIAGEVESAVTMFRMTDRMDAGPIVYQQPIVITDSLDSIFNRIYTWSYRFIKHDIIYGYKPIITTPQDESQATYCKRRTPEMSEITEEELRTKSALYIYNKIRALYSTEEDYPTAFIKCADGSKLHLTKGFVEK